jgi:hypothetical protein
MKLRLNGTALHPSLMGFSISVEEEFEEAIAPLFLD